MPVNSVPTFNPYDEDSWFFGFMSRTDATDLLSTNNETGAFLVRESTTAKGDLVLSVKENDKVSHYIINRILSTDKSHQLHFKIGEHIFYDIPTLLTYYMMNNLDDTPLKVPTVLRDPPFLKRSFTKDYLAEVQSDTSKMVPSSMQRKLPGLAKVIQSRIPNAYDRTALTLREGDIIRVTKVDISGCWEGEICENGNGKCRKGHFPFNYVKFIEDPNE